MDNIIKHSFFEKAYYAIVLFLYIYAPNIAGLPYNPAKFMLLIIVAEALYRKLFLFKQFIIPQLLLYLGLIIYTYSILIFHGTFSHPNQQGPIQQILTQALEIIPFSILFINILNRRGYTLEDFIDFMLIIVFIQGIIVLLQFISIEARSFFQNILGIRKIKSVGQFQWFRGLAFAITKNYDFSLVQSFGLFFIISKFLTKKIKAWHYLTIVLIFFTITISGRTGFIGIAFALLVLFLRTFRFNQFMLVIRRLSISVGIILILYNALQFTFPSIHNSINDNVLPWAFEFYYNYLETGEFSTDSSDQLQDSHYYNLSDKTLFHGDGMYMGKTGFYYGLTDAGYMRQAMYFGVFGIFLFYILYLRMALLNYSKLSNYYNFIIPSLTILLLIGHYKGDVFTNSLLLNRYFYVSAIGLLFYAYKQIDKNKINSITHHN